MSQEPPEDQLSETLFDNLRRFGTTLSNLNYLLLIGGVLSVILAIVVISLFPDIRISGFILLGIGMVLLVLSLVFSLSTVSRTMVARQGRYGTNTLVMIVAFAGILGLVNFLVFENPPRIDVTATKQFSLHSTTLNLLKNLKEPVQATGFFNPLDPRQEIIKDRVDDVLHEFEARSDNFSFRFIDPDTQPEVARAYNIIQYPTIIFEGMESQKRHAVPSPLERDLVTGLLIATGQDQKEVYFLTGHGEGDIFDDAADGYLLAREGLERDNYTISPLDLVREDKEKVESILTDTGVVIIVPRPKQELRESELEDLHGFLKQGGRMVLLLEPDSPDTFRQLVQRWGVSVNERYILDLASFVRPNPTTPLLTRAGGNYLFSPVPELTDVLDRTFYPGVTSLEPVREEIPPTILIAPLAVTFPQSWLVDSPEATEPQESDPPGPHIVAAAVKALAPLDEEPSFTETGEPTETSIIVFGDSDFASNRFFFDGNNGDFLLNSVNWLTGDVALIGIKPKEFVFRELVLTSNEFDFIRYSSWFLLPSIMVVMGTFVWWRRR